MKYSFLLPYKNRVDQFYNTVISLQHWYGDRDDWEAIVIVDGLAEKIRIPGNDPRIKTYRVGRNGAVNPAPLFNAAARKASGEYLIISNPECYHASNVLGWFDGIFAKDKGGYAVVACDHVKHVGRVESYQEKLGSLIMVYQHSHHRNLLYHFCSAMSRDRWEQLGGFDERFGAGYCYDDDDFRDRVLCAGIPWYVNDGVKVLHQEHGKYRHDHNITARFKLNAALYQQGQRERKFVFNPQDYQVPLDDPRNRS